MKKFDEFINENYNDVTTLLKSIYTDFFDEISDEIGHDNFWKEISVGEIPPQNGNTKSYDVFITIKYPTKEIGTLKFQDAKDNLKALKDMSKRLETIIGYKDKLGLASSYYELVHRTNRHFDGPYEQYILTGSADGNIFNPKSLDYIESKIGKEKLDLFKSMGVIKKYNL